MTNVAQSNSQREQDKLAFLREHSQREPNGHPEIARSLQCNFATQLVAELANDANYLHTTATLRERTSDNDKLLLRLRQQLNSLIPMLLPIAESGLLSAQGIGSEKTGEALVPATPTNELETFTQRSALELHQHIRGLNANLEEIAEDMHTVSQWFRSHNYALRTKNAAIPEERAEQILERLDGIYASLNAELEWCGNFRAQADAACRRAINELVEHPASGVRLSQLDASELELQSLPGLLQRIRKNAIEGKRDNDFETLLRRCESAQLSIANFTDVERGLGQIRATLENRMPELYLSAAELHTHPLSKNLNTAHPTP